MLGIEEMTVKCPICGAANHESASYCSSCGNRIPRPPPSPPAHQFAVVALGLLAGSCVGLLVGVMSQYYPGPPYLPYMVLIYGLGAFVVLVCNLEKRLFPSKMRVYLTSFSVAFAGSYYFFCFGYFYVRAV
jgi:hypothetical protein